MIIEAGGGKSGFKEYLETGQKKGRELHRDQLDQRIALFGDLDVFELATSAHAGTGRTYDHLTLSFSENNISNELLEVAVREFRDHALVAWPEEERHRIAFYAEAHRPKILSYTNSETGETVDRLIHIHIGMGRHDLITGKAIEPLGYLGEEADNRKYIDAWQESFNASHGLSSPKDNPKITPENAVDVLARYTGQKPDELGTFNEKKAALEITLQKEILARDITTWADFEELLAEHGEVTKMHEGRFDECYRIKPTGSGRAMRLKGVFFGRQFIERPTAEKLAIVQSKAKAAYLEQMQPRKEPAYVAAVLSEWHTFKAREHRYLHTGSPLYKNQYLPADTATRLQILDELEREGRDLPPDELSHNLDVTDFSHLTRDQIRKGVEHVINRAFDQGRPPDHILRHNSIARESEKGRNGGSDPSRPGGLHELPSGNLDTGGEGADLLLPGSLQERVGDNEAGQYHPVRRAGASEEGGGRFDGSTGAIEQDGGKASAGEFATSRIDRDRVELRTAEQPAGGESGQQPVAIQPGSVVDFVRAELLDRYQQAADKERYAEIRKHLDCAQLLARLSHSHGLNPELYQAVTAKDGTPRIQCGSRALSPSDFLLKELGIQWREAAPILRTTYELQIGHRVTKPRASKGAPNQLWKDFKADQLSVKEDLTKRLKVFDESAKARRAAFSKALLAEQKAALAGLSGDARKGAHSLAKLHAATAKAELNAMLKEERQELRKSIQPRNAWQLYLQKRAQEGSEEALLALRKLDDSARAKQPEQGIVGTIVLDDEEEKRRIRFAREASARFLKLLAHTVERNGDITYRQNGHAVLRDEGRHLAVLDEHSHEAIGAALLIAREKFGSELSLTGSIEFQQRAVAVAVEQNIFVTFANPQLEALRQRLVEEKRRPARAPEKPTTKPIPQVEMPAVNVPAVEAVPPVMEVPAVEVEAPAPTCAEWVGQQSKLRSQPRKSGDGAVEFVVAYVADSVVLDHGRTVALYPKPGFEVRPGQRVVIHKDGSLLLAPDRLDLGAGKGGPKGSGGKGR